MNQSIIVFKDWLPDLPDLDNPGVIDAKNAMPVDGSFKPFPVLASSGQAWGATVNGAFSASPTLLYAGSATAVGVYASGAWATLSSATLSSGVDDYWEFARYEDYVFATNYANDIQYHTLGSSGTLNAISAITASTAVYRARQMGIVGQFLVIGDTCRTAGSTVNHRIAWSGIDDPLNWPTPGSSTAIAVQSGDQLLPAEFGAVTAIVGGDQYGVVFQKAAITRMTYVGGTSVFQFDQIDKGRGAFFPRSVVQAGSSIYYANLDGFWVTDGTQTRSLGKVSDYFQKLNLANTPNALIGAHDSRNGLIWWMYPSNIIFYNYLEDRWGRGEHSLEYLVASAPDSSARAIRGFNTSHAPNYFSGASATMAIVSGEKEGNPGGYTRVSGIKPLIGWNTLDGSGPSAAVTVALGYRNDMTSDVTYTSETTANARSGFADFRNEARYHRARVTIDPTAALDDIRSLGIQVISEASGLV